MRNKQFRCCTFRAALGFSLLLLAATVSQSQSVISRARIGGYAEDVTHVSSGALKNYLVMIDGFEAYGVLAAKSKEPFVKLFDLKFPEFDMFANGLTYVPSESLFFFNQANQPTKLFLVDQAGGFKGTRPIQYLNPAYRPAHMEGLAYIPPTSPLFPDHIAMVVLDTTTGPCRVEIVRRDGVVVSEIFRPDWPASFLEGSLGDVSFLAPNKLLATTFGEGVWTMDFSGNMLSGPLTFPSPITVGEGIVQLPDGRIVATSYPQSLVFLDSSLNRLPASDRNDVIGQNLNLPSGIAWNSDTDRLLISHDFPAIGLTPGIAAMPATLDSAIAFTDLSPFANPHGWHDVPRRRTPDCGPEYRPASQPRHSALQP